MLAGLALAAPVGPVGLLCIRRTLSRGMLSGFLSGMGAAVADAIYASVAAFGVTVISSTLTRYSNTLEIVGGILLCILGVHAIVSHRVVKEREITAQNMVQTFFSTLVLTLTNPATIIGYAALFSALGLIDEEGSRQGAIVLVAGVFAGSALWWLLLSTVMHHLRHFISDCGLKWINLVSGSFLTLFGIGVIVAWFMHVHINDHFWGRF
jgi:threonine/homoserine/homoserine lactone efflux protein